MAKPKNIKRKSIKVVPKSCITGSAIIETVAGLFVLLPVFLLLVDIIALVIAQSVNDDLAKQAARYAAQTPLILNADGITPNIQAMRTAATTVAQNYVENTSYGTATNGIITNAIVSNIPITFDTTTGVQVITQVQCNLPIPVPFGGPSSTTFQAQATLPPVDIQPGPTQNPN